MGCCLGAGCPRLRQEPVRLVRQELPRHLLQELPEPLAQQEQQEQQATP